MTPISFFAEGVPKGQPRPRAFAMNGKARVYDPGTAEGWKSAVAVAARPFLSTRFTEPVSIAIVFVLPRPKKHFFTGKKADLLRPDAPLYDGRKPDLDNYEKAVWDSLVIIGLLADDCLIVKSDSTKIFSPDGRTGAFIALRLADTLFAQTLVDKITNPRSASLKVEDAPRTGEIAGSPPVCASVS
jgi:Holliday junction resolvase RusA-like endonuclease